MDKKCYNPELWGGIECTINRIQNVFNDQLIYSGHYQRQQDLDLLASTGIKKIRYPILWEAHQPSTETAIDFGPTRRRIEALQQHNIEIIAGLVHHGSGPAFTHLLDPRFPELLAAYAGKVAEAFPDIQYYTPVNEPLTTARFSGLYGLWYPHKRSTKACIQMLLVQLKATVLSMEAIRSVRRDAQLVQTEDLGKTYSTPLLRYQARYENERRWLTYDILCGRFNEQHKLWKHFKRLGIPATELQFFLDHPCPPDIFGFNHYLTSERFLDERMGQYPQHSHGGNGRHRYADIEAVRVELQEESGIGLLLQEAWNRYEKPMAVTEVHLQCHREEQLRWFRHVWQEAGKLRQQGVDIRAVTSWAMLGSFGWNRLLTQPGGDYEPGAFDVSSGTPRPTALAQHLKNLGSENVHPSRLCTHKGWWQRSTRILYGAPVKDIGMNSNGQLPLLIIGKNGTLGRAFARVCEERCIPFRLLSRQDCDISQPDSIRAAIEGHQPWAVLNAAGFVRVDDAEVEQQACFRDNTEGPGHLAAICAERGLPLVSYSSDLVFDGTKQTAYVESDAVRPLNEYGRSKAESERLILDQHPGALLIRTSAFFSPWDEYNFVHAVRRQLSMGEPFVAASDCTVSPTYVPDLAHASLDLLMDGASGVWHLANQGSISWADLAHRVAHAFDLDGSLIEAKPVGEMNLAAPRPRNSALASERGRLMPTLDHALERYVQEEKREKRQVA